MKIKSSKFTMSIMTIILYYKGKATIIEECVSGTFIN